MVELLTEEQETTRTTADHKTVATQEASSQVSYKAGRPGRYAFSTKSSAPSLNIRTTVAITVASILASTLVVAHCYNNTARAPPNK